LISTTDGPWAELDFGSLGHRDDVVQFSLGRLRLAMKQMHHSLWEITVPESVLKAFAATNQLKFKLALKHVQSRTQAVVKFLGQE
jgi:hypothetical protein